MKKSKLYGSRLIEDNEQTITPELVTLESTDNVTNLTFDRGNILDAASVKQYQTAVSDDLTTKYNTLSENVTTNSNDIITINTQLTTTAESINSINANITTINNSLVDYGVALEYVDNKLILKNKNSDTLSSIDLSIMTGDTYLDTVTFSNNKLIFTWNQGSSKQPVTIDLSELKDKDGNILSVGNILSLSKDLFISKNDADAAKGIITFLKGIRVGNYTGETGAVIDVDKNSGQTYLEVDKLKVRMKAYFETLSIINEQSIAGKWTISPGGSIQCTRVNITAEQNYKCYFTNIQDNVQIENKFAVNDLAISKDFNIKTVEYQSATNHYYWRKVLEVGEDYIVLSKTDCDTSSDAPNVGDVICQLGNTTNADRQNALVFSSVDETSPCVNLYSGINTYSLANKEYVSYGVNKTTNKAFMNVYGDMYFGDRPTITNNYEGASYIKYDSTNKKVTVKGELDVASTVGGTDINQYIRNNSMSDADVNALISNSTVISDLQGQIDGAIETYFYSGVPTLSNLPASGWVQVATPTNKETYTNHIGDLYYDKDTGKAYRFMLDGDTGIYSWVIITDVGITKALADSAEALSTANVKRRIFYGTPTVPYDKGDLWVDATYPAGTTTTNSSNNQYYKEILYCTTLKTTGGTFSITDWSLSNNYTKVSNDIITDLNGYAYIKEALANDTQTTGGLILSSLIALRDANNNVQSGINGILNNASLGKGIATWWGGKMIDGLFTPDTTTTTVTDYATSLIRFNGSGYLANGAISWDTNGKIHADPTSFFVGPTSIGIIASLFSTIPTDATSYSQVTKIHPTKPFDTLTVDTITATSFIGELQGNAATATKLKTPRTIWGQSFDGSGNVDGILSIRPSTTYYNEGIRIHKSTNNRCSIALCGADNTGDSGKSENSWNILNDNNNCFVIDRNRSDGINGLIINQLGYVGIGTSTPRYKLDINGTMRSADGARFDKGAIFLGQTTAPTDLGTYVLNYVSSTYGARVTAYNGTNYQKLNIGKLISGTNFQLELNTDGTSKFNGGVIASGVESSKGGLFFGQYATMPSGLGTYVANYVSDSYGARVLAYDGSAYKDLKLGAMPTSGVFGMTLSANGDTRIGYNIGTSNFASHTTGWNVSVQGAADFRNIYADELRVQAFTADISQALAGSDYLTKSVSKLSANFVVPSVNSTVRIIVDDIEGMPATQCFSNGDYIRFRAFNRTSGLTIANVWGTVTLDTTFGTNGFSNGTQAYTFTCKATTGAGLTVFKGSEVLDYGTSGSGMISRTTLDAMGSPYEQIATWVNDPSVANNYTVHARLGNLGGIANCNGYGLYTDNGFFTGKITVGDLTKTNHYLDFSDGALTVRGNILLASGYSAVSTLDMSSGISLAVNNVQVGARNLVAGTSTPKTITATSPDYYVPAYSFFHLEANKDYIFSCEVDCPTWGYDTNTDTVEAFILKDGLQSYYIYISSDSYTQLSTGLYRNTHVFQVTQSGSYLIRLDVNHSGSTHTFSSVMVTEGNKRTTWAPAPEDVDASINLKVSKDGVIGAINLTSEAATINASKINLIGAVTIGAIDKSSVTPAALGAATPTDVTTAVDNIQIGGRNLIAGSSLSEYTASYPTSGFIDYQVYLSTEILKGTQYVMSFWAKSTVENDKIVSYFYNPNTTIYGLSSQGATTGYNDGNMEITLSTTWKYYWISYTTDGTDSSLKHCIFMRLFSGTGSGTVSMKGCKLESGTKATDWTPAPEDVDSSISAAQSDATKAITRNNTMAVKLGYTDYNALASAASLGHTLIDGGFVNTQLIQAVAVVTNGLTANCITANMISSGSVTSDKIYSGAVTTDKLFAGAVTATTIAAGAVTTDKLYVGAVTADKIAANTITAAKIAANTITADQINVNNVSAAIATVISLDAGRITTGKLSADRIDAVSVVTKGLVAQTIDAQSATISNLNVVNATVSGTLNGVSGTFDYLKGVGSSGSLVFGKYGMTFEDEDFSQQGTKNSRTLRFYSGNIRCRGAFGATSLNMARVHDTVIDYYVNGDTDSYVRFNLQSNGVGGYYIPLYPTSDTGYSSAYGNATLADIYGFPVDLVVFDNTAVRQYELLAGSTGKKVTLVNANNNYSNIYLNINGATDRLLHGGAVQQYVNIRELTNPLISSSVHGAGWLMISDYVNNWA